MTAPGWLYGLVVAQTIVSDAPAWVRWLAARDRALWLVRLYTTMFLRGRIEARLARAMEEHDPALMPVPEHDPALHGPWNDAGTCPHGGDPVECDAINRLCSALDDGALTEDEIGDLLLRMTEHESKSRRVSAERDGPGGDPDAVRPALPTPEIVGSFCRVGVDPARWYDVMHSPPSGDEGTRQGAETGTSPAPPSRTSDG